MHGPSEVIDPPAFDWPDEQWHGRPWHEAVIYELHVGTSRRRAPSRGVGRGSITCDLGITAIELMPLADFPGARNWGYDGVLPYAPEPATAGPRTEALGRRRRTRAA